MSERMIYLEEVIFEAIAVSMGARFLPDEAQAFLTDDVAQALRKAGVIKDDVA